MPRPSSRSLLEWRDWLFGHHDHSLLFFLSVIMGLLAGYAALGFRLAVDALSVLVYNSPHDSLLAGLAERPAWVILLVPAVGGLIVGHVLYRLFPGRQPQGIADVIEASSLRNARMSTNEGMGAALISAVSLGFGASAGREGPIVHLCSTIGSLLSRRLHLGSSMSRTMLGCGAAAGVAAAFNAPIAGVFFALEVVIGHYGMAALSPVVISSVIGTIITRIHIGDDPAFQLLDYPIASFLELPAFIILGVVCASVAIALIRGTMIVTDFYDRLGISRHWRPAIAGLLIGLIALQFPEVLGVSYEATNLALQGQYLLVTIILLAIAKGLASALTLGSGFGGGIVGPALCIGALTGAAFGHIATQVMPSLGSDITVYAIVGMAATTGATLAAPVSTILMIFELTGNYRVTLMLMVAVSIASLLLRRVNRLAFFGTQLKRRGIRISGARERGLLRQQQVRAHMDVRVQTLDDSMPLNQLKERFRQDHAPIYTISEAGVLSGVIEPEDLADAVFDPDADLTRPASSIQRYAPAMLEPSDHLDHALQMFEQHHVEHLPVVDSRELCHVIGEVRYRDLLLAYNTALIEARRAERGENDGEPVV